ncbi:MAG: transcriptional regulator [Lachnoclostridium sp.]|jgi:predicted transcriptional regulator of viral defense system|nr:transcriptional regulator [Lachnoclostridium sp.]
MKYYADLLAMGCFTREDLTKLTGNYNTAGTLLKRYLQKGYLRKVRRNLYVAINLADDEPVVSKFRIAGGITPTSYVSHHAAFDYYGCTNQVSYQIEVSSATPFMSFVFDGNTYICLDSRIADGIVTRPDGIRVTDTERTVLDGINDFEKVMGLEELLRCLALLPSVMEDKLLSYLAVYNKQVLYQKTGYILRHFQREFHLSEAFFSECAAHIGKSTRYLITNENGMYNKEWQLITPENLMSLTTKGAEENAEL